MLEPGLWWLALFGVYLCVISTISPTELLVGAVAAAACAAAAVAVHRVLLGDLDSHGGALRALPLLPAQIVRDCGALFRPRVEGRFAEVPVRAGGGGGLATVVLSASPGTYVVRVARDRRTLLVHRIGRRVSRLERVVADEEVKTC